MKATLALAAVGEAATGLLLLVYPPIVVELLFGAQIAGVGIVMSRIAGIALIALGVACWPGGAAGRALSGMLTHTTFAALYFLYVGIGGGWAGRLLWPAVAVHVVLMIVLGRAWRRRTKDDRGVEKPRGAGRSGRAAASLLCAVLAACAVPAP